MIFVDPSLNSGTVRLPYLKQASIKCPRKGHSEIALERCKMMRAEEKKRCKECECPFIRTRWKLNKNTKGRA